MSRKCAWVMTLGLGFAAVVNANSAPPRAEDPDWPCQQRLVPELTAAAYWNGLPLQGLGDWRADPEVADLVRRLAPRRVTTQEGLSQIASFAQKYLLATRYSAARRAIRPFAGSYP